MLCLIMMLQGLSPRLCSSFLVVLSFRLPPLETREQTTFGKALVGIE